MSESAAAAATVLTSVAPDQGRAAPPAPPARRAATSADAENAQLDAQLEVAAKKAALRGFEAQANGGPVIVDAPMPPMPPGAARGTIMIERDGKTIVLENPTPEQLAQVGISGAPQPDAKMIVSLTGATLVAIVLIIWMVLNHLRRSRTPAAVAPKADPEMAARMARIENAIESVAVEVERISEGQRFTSRLLSEGAAVPIVGAAQGERVMRANGEG